MTDGQLLDLIAAGYGAPRLVEGDRKYIYIDQVAAVLVLNRIGKGERWALSPSSGFVRLEAGKVPQAQAYAFSLRALKWIYQAARINFVAHARAMGARSL